MVFFTLDYAAANSDLVLCIFFFFKQKTAYEMRISDWSSDVCSSDLQSERLVLRAKHRLERDRGAIPGVDHHHHIGEVDHLIFGELRARLGIDVVWHAVRRQPRERFGPFQRGALAIAEQARFPPDGDMVKPTLPLTTQPSLLHMHVYEIGIASCR